MREELIGPPRDGTSQAGRVRAELAPGYVRLDERSPADLIAFAQGLARHLRWYGPDGRPDGDWSAMFEGLAPVSAPGIVSHAEAAAFAADPAAFDDPRFATLRRPHMMLLLACIRLLRHGQDAVNAIAERHHDHHLREVLGLEPAPPRPERAFVLFDPAPGTVAVEAPAGLRLLAGRDARRRDRVFRLDDPVMVTRARVARLATSFVDREVVDLETECRTPARDPDARAATLLSLAYGTPRPGDAPPPFGDEALTAERRAALARLLAFGMRDLRLGWSELRVLVERQRRRNSDAADWAAINATIEQAGRTLRGDPDWRLEPDDPRAFEANLRIAFRDRDPMVDNGLEQVESIDDLYLRRDRPEVEASVTKTLRLDPAAFAAMMETKRRLDADRNVVDGYLLIAARRRDAAAGRKPPDLDGPAEPPPTIEAAVGPIAWDDCGPEGEGIGDAIAYLDRVAAVERWFSLPAGKVERLLALLDRPTLDDAAGAEVVALLTEAHGARVLADERERMRDLRATGLSAALAEATGEPAASTGLLEAFARWTTPEAAEMVRAAEAAPDAAPWPRIDAALAQARRRRLALPAPVARREHRHSLWVDTFDPPAAPADARPAFGMRPDDRRAEPATLGWAIVSPALALSTGHRRVSLTLVFADDDGDPLIPDVDGGEGTGETPLRHPFVVDVSACDAWLVPAEVAMTAASLVDPADPAAPDADRRRIALTLSFTLDAAEPATAPPTGEAGPLDWPMLRLRLRAWRDGDRVTTGYDRYRTLRLLRAELRTRIGGAGDVAGLSPLIVETDAGVVDGKRPFEPFGPAASRGAHMTIGHRDLAGKRLTTLALRWQWQAPPADIATHYAAYPSGAFVARLALVDGRGQATTLVDAQPLFAPDPAAMVRTDDLAVGPASGRPHEQGRRVVMTLVGRDFGHAAYPSLVVTKAAEQATALQAAAAKRANPPDPAPYTVLPPYTPRLRHLSLDLTAAHVVDLAGYDRAGAVDRLYHLHPMGMVEAPEAATGGWPLLPRYDEEGALYIGLDRVAAPQTVSLLVDAVANGDGGDAPAGLRWAYLDKDGWVDLPEAPRDTSLGLARTGLVRLALPVAAPDGRMPHSFYWLRASVASGAAGASAIAGLHAQAGSATEAGDDVDGAAGPCPAGTIRGIADPVRGIAKVRQPYAGFGGVPRESEADFRLRAGEDIRHKGRAVTAWDYERLVLARFPDVHKVKCIPATLATGLGLVRLLIVPDVRTLRLADPFAPRAPAALLAEVEAHIRPLAPATARVVAVHPVFVRVRVRVAVRFREANDLAFQKRRLTDAINRHLAPWAFGEGNDITLGQRIEATALVAFIDALPFVDFVAGCRLFQADGDGPYTPGAIERGEAAASDRPDAVLTPAAEHEIDVVGDQVADPQQFTGIGHMKIGLDLIVVSEGER